MHDLFDGLDDRHVSDWQPDPPPPLDHVHDIELDCETTGLRWWAGDRPLGIAIRLPSGYTQYLPFGHAGGNLDEAVVKRWAQRELRGKRITNLNTRFDIHMLRVWGVDLEAQDNEVSDVGHYAALLDDHRQHFNLNAIAQDYLGVGKTGQDLEKPRMASYHAGMVDAYARRDVELVGRLREHMWPLLAAEGLHKVRSLEDQLIYVVCEMEKNGARIDIEKLELWIKETERDLHQILFQIFHETGLSINVKAPTDLVRLFDKLHLPIVRTKDGNPSFTAQILGAIEHPIIKEVVRARRILDLRSKYLLPYSKSVDRSTGIMRYSLHQLRSEKDQWSDRGAAGTVSGRFSATQATEDEGFNIQQVMKPEKQMDKYGPDHIVRELHIPEDDHYHLSSDAMQIEYRIFAHETGAKRLTKIYEDDPEASFHKKTHEIFLQRLPKLTYRRMKDCNFAQIYGAGLLKKAFMLEYITEAEFLYMRQIVSVTGYSDPAVRDNPKLVEIRQLNRVYDQEIPEARALLEETSRLAEDRGYIKTFEGRRARFINGARAYKALNSRIQGSAADVMKRKLVDLHRARHQTGFKLRWTVHDEVDGDVRELEQAKIVAQILNIQSYKLRVPLLWETSIGPNWANLQDIRKATPRKREGQFDRAHAVDPSRSDYYDGTEPQRCPVR